jgi:hypothetical protein
VICLFDRRTFQCLAARIPAAIWRQDTLKWRERRLFPPGKNGSTAAVGSAAYTASIAAADVSEIAAKPVAVQATSYGYIRLSIRAYGIVSRMC